MKTFYHLWKIIKISGESLKINYVVSSLLNSKIALCMTVQTYMNLNKKTIRFAHEQFDYLHS